MYFKILSQNGPYLWKESSALFGNVSFIIKSISVLIVLIYFLSFSPSVVSFLALTPGYLFPPHFWIWTLFTHCFLEIHITEVLLDIIALVLVGKLLEPLWGSREMMTFFFVINVGVGFFAAIFYYILYASTFNAEVLFEVHIHGLSGTLAAISVAVKQIMPDHILGRFLTGKLRNTNVPLLLFLLTLILWFFHVVQGSYCTMFALGLIISWIYLRFYQIHSNGTRGDMAESFSFPSFFPNVLQPSLTVICNALFALLVRIKVCRRPIRKYDVGSSNSISITLPGHESHDSDRRRQIALKALGERLSKAEASKVSSWPTLDSKAQENKSTVSPDVHSSNKDERSSDVIVNVSEITEENNV